MSINLEKISVGAEVGCGDWRSCDIKNYNVDKIYLFEPNILFYQDIIQKCANNDQIKSFHCALSDRNYIEDFYHYGYTSFLKGAPGFVNLWLADGLSIQPELYYKGFTSKVLVCDAAILDKNIELLILTCQGCEFNVLSRLQFRPKYIQVKYYLQTPEQMAYFNLISHWMFQNGYKGFTIDKSELDTYYNVMFTRN